MAFSYPSKLIIALACGNRCALCTKTLAFETTSGELAQRGEAAHIAGEQPKAARYDISMTEEERNDPKNGIYLCLDCHKEIDDISPEKYPTTHLLEKKASHEKLVFDSISEAIGKVTFKELSEVCTRLLHTPTTNLPSNFDLLEIDKKLSLNKLGPKVQNYITMGLSLNSTVQKFIESEDAIHGNFGEKLKNGFLKEYYSKKYDGIEGDALFEALISLAGRLSTEQHAAVLAVLAYLFARCEVFEKL